MALRRKRYTNNAANGVIRRGPIPNPNIGRTPNPGVMGVFVNPSISRGPNINKSMFNQALNYSIKEGAKSGPAMAMKARAYYARTLKGKGGKVMPSLRDFMDGLKEFGAYVSPTPPKRRAKKSTAKKAKKAAAPKKAKKAAAPKKAKKAAAPKKASSAKKASVPMPRRRAKKARKGNPRLLRRDELRDLGASATGGRRPAPRRPAPRRPAPLRGRGELHGGNVFGTGGRSVQSPRSPVRRGNPSPVRRRNPRRVNYRSMNPIPARVFKDKNDFMDRVIVAALRAKPSNLEDFSNEAYHLADAWLSDGAKKGRTDIGKPWKLPLPKTWAKRLEKYARAKPKSRKAAMALVTSGGDVVEFEIPASTKRAKKTTKSNGTAKLSKEIKELNDLVAKCQKENKRLGKKISKGLDSKELLKTIEEGWDLSDEDGDALCGNLAGFIKDIKEEGLGLLDAAEKASVLCDGKVRSFSKKKQKATHEALQKEVEKAKREADKKKQKAFSEAKDSLFHIFRKFGSVHKTSGVFNQERDKNKIKEMLKDWAANFSEISYLPAGKTTRVKVDIDDKMKQAIAMLLYSPDSVLAQMGKNAEALLKRKDSEGQKHPLSAIFDKEAKEKSDIVAKVKKMKAAGKAIPPRFERYLEEVIEENEEIAEMSQDEYAEALIYHLEKEEEAVARTTNRRRKNKSKRRKNPVRKAAKRKRASNPKRRRKARRKNPCRSKLYPNRRCNPTRRRRRRNPDPTFAQDMQSGDFMALGKQVLSGTAGYVYVGGLTYLVGDKTKLVQTIGGWIHKDDKGQAVRTGRAIVGSFIAGSYHFVMKQLKVPARYAPSMMVGASIHAVRLIADALLPKSQNPLRRTLGLQSLSGYEVWYPEGLAGYEVWDPELSGYEDWTPELAGYEDWTPELAGYEDWTPELAGYEDWRPEQALAGYGYEDDGLGNWDPVAQTGNLGNWDPVPQTGNLGNWDPVAQTGTLNNWDPVAQTGTLNNWDPVAQTGTLDNWD